MERRLLCLESPDLSRSDRTVRHRQRVLRLPLRTCAPRARTSSMSSDQALTPISHGWLCRRS